MVSEVLGNTSLCSGLVVIDGDVNPLGNRDAVAGGGFQAFQGFGVKGGQGGGRGLLGGYQ